jgi:hypothetical protein
MYLLVSINACNHQATSHRQKPKPNPLITTTIRTYSAFYPDNKSKRFDALKSQISPLLYSSSFSKVSSTQQPAKIPDSIKEAGDLWQGPSSPLIALFYRNE